MGGLLGVMFVTSVIVIAPITGTVVFFSISLAGQFFISLIIDHYGLFNIAKHEINPMKIAGILLILLGTYVIQYSKS
jgi:transporter family-2 protein